MNKLSLDIWSEWDILWSKMRNEFFKVESLQTYQEESTSLDMWKRGDKLQSIEMMYKDFHKLSLPNTKKSVQKIRIRIVDEPYSDYIEWELEVYKLVNIPIGGEEVYIVNRKDIPNYTIGDFMMFDETSVARPIYNNKGALSKIETYRNNQMQKFIQAKYLLINNANRLNDV